jgi:hypothetical protein
VATTSAIVYYSLIDIENDNIPIEALPCNHNLVAKGFLARNLTHGKAIHRVFLHNLLPNRRYCYEIASGHASSNLYSFRTAAASNNTHNHFSTSLILNGNKYDVQQKYDLFDLVVIKDEDKMLKDTFPYFIDTLKNQISNEKINAFINLPSVDLNEFFRNEIEHRASHFDEDFLDRYYDVLSNVQILPTIGNYGKKGLFFLRGGFQKSSPKIEYNFLLIKIQSNQQSFFKRCFRF